MNKNGQPDVYTTGQVARMCRVSSRTVVKWTDTGGLTHYTLPQSNDRRIPRHSLIEYLTKHNIPLPTELQQVGQLNFQKDPSGRYFLGYDNNDPPQLWVWRGEPDETAEPWIRVE